MGEISLMLNQANQKLEVERLEGLHSLKSSKHRLGQVHKPASQSAIASVPSPVKSSPSKMSHLPVRKGSTLNKSLPRVSDSFKSTMNSDGARKQESSDSGFKGSSEADSVSKSESGKQTPKNMSPRTSEQKSPRSSNQSIRSEELWASPNTSSYCPSSSGLFEKMDEFAFSDKPSSLVKENLGRKFADELRENFKMKYMISDVGQGQRSDNNFVDREKTPPPDGDENFVRSMVKKLSLSKSKPFDNSVSHTSQNCESYRKGTCQTKRSQIDSAEGKDKFTKETLLREERPEEHEMARLSNSVLDHGYMPGHHIPDGTAYSQRSDYAHMDHKGQSREDVAGVDDVGLAESRGFDMLRGASDVKDRRNIVDNTGTCRNHLGDVSGKLSHSVVHNKSLLPLNLKPTQSKSPMTKLSVGSHVISTQTVTQNLEESDIEDLRNAETQTNLNTNKKHESWTQTSLVLRESRSEPVTNIRGETTNEDNCLTKDRTMSMSELPPKQALSSFRHNLLPDSEIPVPDKPNLLTKQSLLKTDFAQENLRRDFSIDVMEKIYSGKNTERFSGKGRERYLSMDRTNVDSGKEAEAFMPMNSTKSDTMPHHEGRESVESRSNWQQLEGRDSIDTTGRSLL